MIKKCMTEVTKLNEYRKNINRKRRIKILREELKAGMGTTNPSKLSQRKPASNGLWISSFLN